MLERFELEPAAFIPGALETFGWLRRKGVALALNTGFDRSVAAVIIGSLPWRGVSVDTVVCSDDVSRGRPSPSMILHAMAQTGISDAAQVMTIGDTVKDLEAGNNAGVGVNIGVLSGAHDRKRLQQVAHTQLLPSIADIPSWWIEQLNRNHT
jgi:phosphonatase-like hydrolase